MCKNYRESVEPLNPLCLRPASRAYYTHYLELLRQSCWRFCSICSSRTRVTGLAPVLSTCLPPSTRFTIRSSVGIENFTRTWCIRGALLVWNLPGRSSWYMVGSSTSPPSTIFCDLQQGSVRGPILFLLRTCSRTAVPGAVYIAMTMRMIRRHTVPVYRSRRWSFKRASERAPTTLERGRAPTESSWGGRILNYSGSPSVDITCFSSNSWVLALTVHLARCCSMHHVYQGSLRPRELQWRLAQSDVKPWFHVKSKIILKNFRVAQNHVWNKIKLF